MHEKPTKRRSVNAIGNALVNLENKRLDLLDELAAHVAETEPTADNPFPHAYGLTADLEGWNLFNQGEDGRGEICRDDERNLFASDDAALAHVRKQAEAGSKVHAAALKLYVPRRRVREVPYDPKPKRAITDAFLRWRDGMPPRS